jgi:hypothetical protein
MSIPATVIVMLLLSVVPARAAGDDGIINTEPRSFHALSRISEEATNPPVALSDDELASITGGRRGFFGSINNLAIIVQINVCAICSQVSQGNAAIIGQVGFLRGSPR